MTSNIISSAWAASPTNRFYNKSNKKTNNNNPLPDEGHRGGVEGIIDDDKEVERLHSMNEWNQKRRNNNSRGVVRHGGNRGSHVDSKPGGGRISFGRYGTASYKGQPFNNDDKKNIASREVSNRSKDVDEKEEELISDGETAVNDGMKKKMSKKKWVQLPLNDVGFKMSYSHMRLKQLEINDAGPSELLARTNYNYRHQNVSGMNVWELRKGSDLFDKRRQSQLTVKSTGARSDSRSAGIESNVTDEDELLKIALQESIKTAQHEEEIREQIRLRDLAYISGDEISKPTVHRIIENEENWDDDDDHNEKKRATTKNTKDFDSTINNDSTSNTRRNVTQTKCRSVGVASHGNKVSVMSKSKCNEPNSLQKRNSSDKFHMLNDGSVKLDKSILVYRSVNDKDIHFNKPFYLKSDQSATNVSDKPNDDITLKNVNKDEICEQTKMEKNEVKVILKNNSHKHVSFHIGSNDEKCDKLSEKSDGNNDIVNNRLCHVNVSSSQESDSSSGKDVKCNKTTTDFATNNGMDSTCTVTSNFPVNDNQYRLPINGVKPQSASSSEDILPVKNNMCSSGSVVFSYASNQISSGHSIDMCSNSKINDQIGNCESTEIKLSNDRTINEKRELFLKQVGSSSLKKDSVNEVHTLKYNNESSVTYENNYPKCLNNHLENLSIAAENPPVVKDSNLSMNSAINENIKMLNGTDVFSEFPPASNVFTNHNAPISQIPQVPVNVPVCDPAAVMSPNLNNSDYCSPHSLQQMQTLYLLNSGYLNPVPVSCAETNLPNPPNNIGSVNNSPVPLYPFNNGPCTIPLPLVRPIVPSIGLVNNRSMNNPSSIDSATPSANVNDSDGLESNVGCISNSVNNSDSTDIASDITEEINEEDLLNKLLKLKGNDWLKEIASKCVEKMLIGSLKQQQQQLQQNPNQSNQASDNISQVFSTYVSHLTTQEKESLNLPNDSNFSNSYSSVYENCHNVCNNYEETSLNNPHIHSVTQKPGNFNISPNDRVLLSQPPPNFLSQQNPGLPVVHKDVNNGERLIDDPNFIEDNNNLKPVSLSNLTKEHRLGDTRNEGVQSSFCNFGSNITSNDNNINLFVKNYNNDCENSNKFDNNNINLAKELQFLQPSELFHANNNINCPENNYMAQQLPHSIWQLPLSSPSFEQLNMVPPLQSQPVYNNYLPPQSSHNIQQQPFVSSQISCSMPFRSSEDNVSSLIINNSHTNMSSDNDSSVLTMPTESHSSTSLPFKHIPTPMVSTLPYPNFNHFSPNNYFPVDRFNRINENHYGSGIGESHLSVPNNSCDSSRQNLAASDSSNIDNNQHLKPTDLVHTDNRLIQSSNEMNNNSSNIRIDNPPVISYNYNCRDNTDNIQQFPFIGPPPAIHREVPLQSSFVTTFGNQIRPEQITQQLHNNNNNSTLLAMPNSIPSNMATDQHQFIQNYYMYPNYYHHNYSVMNHNVAPGSATSGLINNPVRHDVINRMPVNRGRGRLNLSD